MIALKFHLSVDGGRHQGLGRPVGLWLATAQGPAQLGAQ